MEWEILSAAKTLWDYHRMGQTPQKSDLILALGSHDLRTAERAAELYLDGFAPIVMMSGGLGNFTKEMWTEKEADKFLRIAVEMGVPKTSILIENQSSNSGENIDFSRKLLAEKTITVHSILLVQKPYMERRAFATIRKRWPEVSVLTTSPQISFEDYPTPDIPMDRVIDIMVGDLQRIKEYPKRGFQIYQKIPDNVLRAYTFLLAKGYTGHLSTELPL